MDFRVSSDHAQMLQRTFVSIELSALILHFQAWIVSIFQVLASIPLYIEYATNVCLFSDQVHRIISLVLDAGGCVIGLNILLFFCVQT
jgi:hypothetical protein